tara:strand:+ start:168 stop:941 length:774 start_codon:yes stop_codon:yes gene_type:complete
MEVTSYTGSLVPIGGLEDLTRVDLVSWRFDYSFCRFNGLDLAGGDYSGFNFLRSDFSGVKFSKENDVFACGDDYLDEPTLIPVLGEENSLENRVYSNLVASSFVKANLSYADLTLCDLGGADLSYANLSRTDLSYANLCGATLMEVEDFSLARFEGAIVDVETIVSYGLLKEMQRQGVNFSNGITVYGVDIDELQNYVNDHAVNGVHLVGMKLVPEIECFEMGSEEGELDDDFVSSESSGSRGWLRFGMNFLKSLFY